MTTARVATFNVNQFSSVTHQKADLIERMATSDVVLTQETVDLPLVTLVADPAVVAKVGQWATVQVRDGDNDGHANTAVLYRVTLGVPTDTDVAFMGDADGTRRRYLTAAELDAWFGALHIFPKRDASDIPEQIANLTKWVKAHPGPVVVGMDRNQCPPAVLENATGLKWHGVGIDGFLTNLPMANVAEFPKGFSDHPGVHAVVTLPEERTVTDEPSKIEQAEKLLHQAHRKAVENSRQERAGRIRKALHALNPKRTTPVTSWPAIASARTQSHDGPPFGVGLCLQRVRMCFNIGPAASDAVGAWNAARTKHATTPPKCPRGYPIFWRGGSAGHGHIAIATGLDQGVPMCWSTDIRRPGFFDYVPIAEIHEKWGLTFLGWTEDLNGTPIVPSA